MLSLRTWNRFRPLLRPVALLYWGLAWWRNFFYSIGFFITRQVSVPVVSIGNLSVGGTGKTPATIYTAQHLAHLGYKVGILSRGYRRSSTGTLLVSDGKHLLVTPEEGGDEPYLLACRLNGVPVVVDEDRYRGATIMIGQFSPDVLLLDDAFQHRSLVRDCDLVLLDASAPLHDYHLFPYGALREHLGALKRADLVVWTRTNSQSPPLSLTRRIDELSVTQIHSTMAVPPQLIEVATEENIPAEKLRDEPILAFCGIARPTTFYHALISLGLEPETVQYYPDHHHYTEDDLAHLSELTEGKRLVMVTTEKDAVKLNSDFLAKYRVYTLRVEFHLEGENLEVFRNTLAACLPLPPITQEVGEA